VPLIPLAAFLVGALLSLLLPVTLLIVLVLWYWKFSMGVPETTTADIPTAPAVREPAPAMGNPQPRSGGAPRTSGEH
jgi:hypothetical protein